MNSAPNNKFSVSQFIKSKHFVLISTVPWVLFCIILGISMVKSGCVGYETNDDFYLGLITGGFFGEYEFHSLYNNALLSGFITLLQRILPGHNWTTIIFLSMIFISYTILGVWNILRNGPLKGYITSFILVFATCNSLICKMNYSKTGTLVFILGFVLLASSLETNNWKTKQNIALRIAAFILICIGSLFRKQIIFSSIPFVGIITLYIFIVSKKDRFSKLIPITASFLAILLLWGVNHIVYITNDDWAATVKYNKARENLLDYGMSPYSFNEAEYSDMNISLNDYVMLGSWQYADLDTYSLDTLQALTKIRDKNVKPQQLNEYVNRLDLFAHSRDNYLFIIYVLLFMFFVVAASSKEEVFKYNLATIGMCFLEIGYLIIKGRVNERAFYVPIIGAIITLMFFHNKEKESSKKVRAQSLVLLSIIAFFAFFASNTYNLKGQATNSFSKNEKGSVDLLEYTSSNKSNLYVMDIFSNMNMLSDVYDPLDGIEKGKHSNITLTGGWMVPSPIFYNMNNNFGDKYNTFKILATNQAAYWVVPQGYDNTLVLTYIQEHYNPDAESTLIDTVGSYNVYSFVQ